MGRPPRKEKYRTFTRSAAVKILDKFKKVCLELSRSESSVLETFMDRWSDRQIKEKGLDIK